MIAVGQKQAYETSMLKSFITNFRQLNGPLVENPEVKSAMETLRQKKTQGQRRGSREGESGRSTNSLQLDD